MIVCCTSDILIRGLPPFIFWKGHSDIIFNSYIHVKSSWNYLMTHLLKYHPFLALVEHARPILNIARYHLCVCLCRVL